MSPEAEELTLRHQPVSAALLLHQYPNAGTNASSRTILNLAVDLKTIFVSQPWWEKDQ